MQKEIEIIKDGLSYNEELECIAKRFGMTQEQALKTIVEEVYNSEASSLGFVEGVRYALNIMDMTDTGKNKELLERLLNILEK